MVVSHPSQLAQDGDSKERRLILVIEAMRLWPISTNLTGRMFSRLDGTNTPPRVVPSLCPIIVLLNVYPH